MKKKQGEFIVIKYCVRTRFLTDAKEWMFAKVTVRGASCLLLTDIDKEEALALIETYGLVLTHHDRDGKVWDTPDQLFRATYGGRADEMAIMTKEKRKRIEK